MDNHLIIGDKVEFMGDPAKIVLVDKKRREYVLEAEDGTNYQVEFDNPELTRRK